MAGKFLVIDALSLIHRAYHAYPPLTNSQGRPIGALYGVSRLFLGVVNQIKPNYVITAFDTKEPTFRHLVYKAYKAKRPKTDQALLDQIPQVLEMFRSAGCHILIKEGFEADDLIGSFITQTRHNLRSADFIILSGDYDLAQLIDGDQVVLHYTKGSVKNAQVINEARFIKDWGFKPALLADYKALAGDTSDNITGVKGIGAKTAQKLISRFGSIDNLYSILKTQPDKVEVLTSKRVVKLLQDHQEEALLSKKLALIKTDLPLPIKPTNLPTFDHHLNSLLTFLQDHNFKSLVKLIQPVQQSPNKPISNPQMTLFN